MKTKLFITAMALMTITTLSFGQPPAEQKQQTQPGRGMAYVDADNDGICDNRETGATNTRQGKGNGNLRADCPNRGQGRGMGPGKGMGPGRGQGRGTGQGNGPAFVDENKNGICDHREETEKK